MSKLKKSRTDRHKELQELARSGQEGFGQVQKIWTEYFLGNPPTFQRMWVDQILRHEYGPLREHLRTQKQVSDDGILPRECVDSFRSSDLGLESRLAAVEEVLFTLPDEPYSTLQTLSTGLNWFIPKLELWGSVMPEKSGKTIYLSQVLETVWNQDCVVGLVIHELAHFILEHESEDDIHDEMRNECEVEETACKWGFEVETTSLKELPDVSFR